MERSKLYAISRLKPEEELRLTGDDLTAAARGMKNHLALLAEPKKDVETTEHKFGKALSSIVQNTLESVNGAADLESVNEVVCRTERRLERAGLKN